MELFESAADRPARAVVDSSGRLVGLDLDTLLLRRSHIEVAQAVVEAVTEAQAAASAQLPSAADAERQLAGALADTHREADRRLSELRVLVSDLNRHPERWR
jgi:hypothetical protein